MLAGGYVQNGAAPLPLTLAIQASLVAGCDPDTGGALIDQAFAAVKREYPDHYDQWWKAYREGRETAKRDRATRVEAEADRQGILADGKALHRARNAGPPSWGRMDPAEALEAASKPREPRVGFWFGGRGIFYYGCVNDVHGESESGKSWFVLGVVAQELIEGRTVTYVDFEDDGGSVYGRLLLLDVPEETLRGDRFRYHPPNGPMTDAEKERFMASATDSDTVVFDGVTEAMSLEGLNPRDEADVAAWHAKYTKGLAHEGKCVIVIDHVPHEGDRAIGSQHKKACITGVSYMVVAKEPIASGARGAVAISVEKDRHAAIRREAQAGERPQYRGMFLIDFTSTAMAMNGCPSVRFEPYKPKSVQEELDDAPKTMTVAQVMWDYVQENDGCTKSEIRGCRKWGVSKDIVDGTLDWLTRKGHVKVEEGSRKSLHHHVGTPIEGESE